MFYKSALLLLALTLSTALGCVLNREYVQSPSEGQIAATLSNATTCQGVSTLIDRNTRRLNAHARVYENDQEHPWNRLSSQRVLQNFALDVSAAEETKDIGNGDTLLIDRLNAIQSILIPPGEPATLSPELKVALSEEIRAFASLCRSAGLIAPSVPYPGTLEESFEPKMPRNEVHKIICQTYGGIIDGYDELYGEALQGLDVGPPHPIRILDFITEAPEFLSLLDELLLLSLEQEPLVDKRLNDLTYSIHSSVGIILATQDDQDPVVSALRNSTTVVAAMDLLVVSTLCAQAELPYAHALEVYSN